MKTLLIISFIATITLNIQLIVGENYCETKSDGLYNNPNDCQSMFWCQNGQAYKSICPYGMYYDPISSVCSIYAIYRCGFRYSTNQALAFHSYPVIPLQSYLLPTTIAKSRQNENGLEIINNNYYENDNDIEPKKPKRKKNLICYFSNWAHLRRRSGKFVPENIDARPCSHIFYAFANLDSESFEVVPGNPLVDINDGFYNRIKSTAKTQNPDVKILLALGGWTDSSSDKYSKLVNDPSKRENFVQKTVKMLKTRQFDGISLDWQYPVCWQSNCKAGNAGDKRGLAQLIKQLKNAFKPNGLILALSVSGYTEIAEKAYDFSVINKNVDMVNVMAYDYHGYWDGVTSHHSPLKKLPNSKNTYFVEYAMEYYAKKGISRQKLNMGIPLYGQSYTLKSKSNSKVNAPTKGPGRAGPYSLQPGFLTYFEICKNVKKNGWKVGGTPIFGGYATKNDQWTSFNEIKTVQLKANHILKNNYAGAALYFIDNDDFNNECCHGPSPLMNSIGSILRGVGKLTEGSCKKPPVVTTPSPPEFTTGFDDGGKYTTAKPWKPAATSTTPRTTTRRTTTRRTTRRTTPRPTATRPPPVEDEDPRPGRPLKNGAKCKTNGKTFPHEDCSKFYRCVNKKILLRKCAKKLLWNNKKGRCDWPNQVSCGRRTVPEGFEDFETRDSVETTTETITSTTSSPTTTTSFEIPESCIPGEYQEVPEECSAFVSCNTRGVPQKRYCRPGLHWIQESLSCDWAVNSNCTEPNGSSLIDSLYSVGAACKNLGNLAPNPNDCTSFLICNHGKYEAIPCPSGLHFDNKIKTCNAPEAANCQSGVVVVQEPETPQQVIPQVTPSPPAPPSVGSEVGIISVKSALQLE